MLISLTSLSPLQTGIFFAVSSHVWGTHPPTLAKTNTITGLAISIPSNSYLGLCLSRVVELHA